MRCNNWSKFLASYHTQALHRQQTETSPVFLWKRPIHLSRRLGLRCRLLVWHTSRNLWKCYQAMEAGGCNLWAPCCHASACWYLPEKSLYPCLMSWFLWLLPGTSLDCLAKVALGAYPHRFHRTVTNKEFLKGYCPQATARGNRNRSPVFLWKKHVRLFVIAAARGPGF